MCSIPLVVISRSYSADIMKFCSGRESNLDICNTFSWNETNTNKTTDWLYKMSYQSINSTISIMKALNSNSTPFEDFIPSVVDYTFINFLTMLVLLAINIFFISFVYNLINEADYGSITPSDFTLMISKIPKDCKDMDELKKDHIMINGIEPYELNLTFKIDQYFEYQRNLSLAKKKYQVCVQRGVETFTTGFCCKTTESKEALKVLIKENKEKIQNYHRELTNLSSNENFNGVAFATFKDNIDYHRYFENFPHSFIGQCLKTFHYIFAKYICCCCYSDAKKRNLSKVINLLVEHAPEPEDVIWENLQFTMTQRFFRMVLVYFISIVLILISFGIILGFNYFQFYAQTEGWTASTVVKYTISIAISLTVSLINYIISESMGKLTAMEKNVSLTQYHLSYSIKLTVFTFINSAVVPLVSNYLNHRWEKMDILLSNLVIIFLSNAAVTPGTQLLNIFYFLRKFKRSRIEKNFTDEQQIPHLTQRELNAMYENPSMEISKKYSWVAKTFLMTVFYLPLFPLGAIISVFGISFSYLVEKFNLLHTYKRPPMLNGEICSFFIYNFKLMIFVFSVGNWVFLSDVYLHNRFALSMIIFFGSLIIIPFHRIFRIGCLGRSEFDVLTKPYTEFYFGFNTDYERQNPITKRKGNQKYLEQLYEKKIIGDETFSELTKKMIKEEVNMIELYYRTSGTMEKKNKNILQTKFTQKFNDNRQKSNYYGQILNDIVGKNVAPDGNKNNTMKQKAFKNLILNSGYNNGYNSQQAGNIQPYGPVSNDRQLVLDKNKNPETNNEVNNNNPGNNQYAGTNYDVYNENPIQNNENIPIYNNRGIPNQIDPSNILYTFDTNNQHLQNPHAINNNEVVSNINPNVNIQENNGYYMNNPSAANPGGEMYQGNNMYNNNQNFNNNNPNNQNLHGNGNPNNQSYNNQGYQNQNQNYQGY